MEQKKAMNRGMAVLLSAALVPTVGVPATAFAEELDQTQPGAQVGTSQDGVAGEGQQGAEGEFTPEQATAVVEVYAENGDLRESYETLEEAVENAQPGDTVKLLDNVTLKTAYAGDSRYGLNIASDIVIDGAGHTIDCGTFARGIRVYGGDTADQRVSVEFRAVTITSSVGYGRCIDTRGGYLDVTLDGSHLVAAGAGNNQPLTVGGSHDELTPITIINGSTIKAGDAGYGITTFNPVDLTVGGASSISGYAALYLKGASGSAGSAGSKVKIIEGAVLSGMNPHTEESDSSFATVSFEDSDIDLVVDGGVLEASASNTAQQGIFGFTGVRNSVSIKGSSSCSVSGENAMLARGEKLGENTLEITGGTFSVDPSDYVPDGYVANEYAGKWVVSKYVPPAPPAPQPETDVEQRPDGSTVTTVTRPDGSQTVTTESADGTESVVSKDAEGNVTSTEVTVSDEAAQAGEVVLPLEPSKPAAGSEKAPAVEVKVPASVTAEAPVKVTVPVEAAEEPNYGVVVYAVDADGNEVLLPKCGVDAEGNAVFEAAGDVTVKVVDASPSFPDTAGEWYGEDGTADFVGARGILTGVPQADGALAFDGGAPTTRAMFVTMLHRAESKPSAPEADFEDMDGSEWYAAAAAWGEAAGVVNGYGDGSEFGGDDPVTREQMAVFAMRYAKHLGLDVSGRADLSAFSDGGQASDWATEALSWAVSEGLLRGHADGSGRLDPKGGATRAETAAVVMRFINGLYA